MSDKEMVKYDPKVWNEYSKVKPPKKGWYRVQFKHAHCTGGTGQKNAWYHLGSEAHPKNFWTTEYWEHKDHSEVMFKPWDDEEMVEPKVWLTVEEAKNVQACVHYCFDHTSETHFRFMNEKARSHLKLLVKRIEQAEKENEYPTDEM